MNNKYCYYNMKHLLCIKSSLNISHNSVLFDPHNYLLGIFFYMKKLPLWEDK